MEVIAITKLCVQKEKFEEHVKQTKTECTQRYRLRGPEVGNNRWNEQELSVMSPS
jgi:hypothetical protein